jgi:hypothetical protein
MKISLLLNNSFDSLGRQAINVLKNDNHIFFSGQSIILILSSLPTSLHKILTEIPHKRRFTNKHECNVVTSFSKY